MRRGLRPSRFKFLGDFNSDLIAVALNCRAYDFDVVRHCELFVDLPGKSHTYLPTPRGA